MLSNEDFDKKIIEFDQYWFLLDGEKINNSLILSDILNFEDFRELKRVLKSYYNDDKAKNPYIHHRWYYLGKTPGEDAQKMMKVYLKNKLNSF